ncbi:MAG: (d)CMP kinase [Candidatus Omnitrophota bacterium]|jgi:cytidylate kinase
MIIAIDGPAGSGKSTVTKSLAKKLGFLHIDTGAMYRALTLKALETKTDIKKSRSVAALARKTKIDLREAANGPLKVYLDERDVSREIRQPQITQHVSDIAKIPGVRKIMLQLQRQVGKKHNCILEGRDIGTVVFPDADIKFFIDAQFDERVQRRYKDMKDLKIKGVTVTDVASDLSNRDTIDSTRKCAPLKRAFDAIYIDTTHMSIEKVVEKLLKKITAKAAPSQSHS